MKSLDRMHLLNAERNRLNTNKGNKVVDNAKRMMIESFLT